MDRLEIRTCAPWRSYKKIVPTLLAHPGAFIATADDDLYYPADWLERLVAAAKGGAGVACLRAHRVTMTVAGPPDTKSGITTCHRPKPGRWSFRPACRG